MREMPETETMLQERLGGDQSSRDDSRCFLFSRTCCLLLIIVIVFTLNLARILFRGVLLDAVETWPFIILTGKHLILNHYLGPESQLKLMNYQIRFSDQGHAVISKRTKQTLRKEPIDNIIGFGYALKCLAFFGPVINESCEIERERERSAKCLPGQNISSCYCLRGVGLFCFLAIIIFKCFFLLLI